MMKFMSLGLILLLVGFGCGERTLKNKTIYDAAKNGNLKELKIFIERGVPINAKDDKNETPLSYAFQKGDSEEIRYLVSKGADVNAKDRYGWTPLIGAACCSDLNLITLLLENGTDIEAKNREGETALMYAVSRRHTDAVELLLTNGANLFVTDNSGESAISYAVDNQIMLELIADKIHFGKSQEGIVSGNNTTNKSNPDWAVKTTWSDTQRDSFGKTALLEAAKQGNIKAVEFLLSRQANVNVTGAKGRTPLSEAVLNGNPEVIKILLEKGAKVNATFDNGTSALMLAAGDQFGLYTENENNQSRELNKTQIHYDQLEVVKMLVMNGADLNMRDDETYGSTSMTALQYALEAGKTNIVEYLRAQGAVE